MAKVEKEGPLQLFGHEFCAEVEAIGSGVENLKEGDRVFWGIPLPCHHCKLCAAGYESLCRSGPVVGIHQPGCLGEYGLLPAECLVKVPAQISASETAAMQPLLSALRRVLAADIEIGDAVAVFGQGVMGLNIAQLCRALGAGKVIGVDIRRQSLELARQMGIDLGVNAAEVDPIESILNATNGIGADIVFECAAGSPEAGLAGDKTTTQSVAAVRDGGKIVPVGIMDEPDGGQIALGPIIRRSVEYRSSRPYTQKEVDWLIELVISKRVQLAPTITHVLDGLDKLSKAIKITANKDTHGAINPAQIVVNH